MTHVPRIGDARATYTCRSARAADTLSGTDAKMTGLIRLTDDPSAEVTHTLALPAHLTIRAPDIRAAHDTSASLTHAMSSLSVGETDDLIA